MKTSVDQLSYFGKPPLFDQPLHVGRPNIGNREHLVDRINDLLDRGWLTNRGPFVLELEHRIAEYLGAQHVIATCNGTLALEIAIRALGLTGEVIVPSFTFIATAHALQWHGITPVFCDIDPQTHNVNPAAIERLITRKTTGILGVHVWGRPCDVEALDLIARRAGLALMFDASHAFGCSYRGRMIGNFGRAEVFSFHATKYFHTVEGGAIATNDGELAQRIRLMQNFGFAGYDRVVSLGTNGKMTEMSAAVGLTNLENIDGFVTANRNNYHRYRSALAGLPGVRLLTLDETERSNFQYIVLEVDERQAGISRDLLVNILHAENVIARRYFHPGCHRMEPYQSLFPLAGEMLRETESLCRKVLALPTGTALREEEVEAICALIRLCVHHGRELTEAASEISQPSVVG